MLAAAALVLSRVVHTSTGPIDGLPVSNGVEKFLGVRFATPPLADLRFAPPVSHNWTGVVPARAHGNCCVPGRPGGSSEGSEDCLFLDVYSPAKDMVEQEESGRPIIVFFYGGSFLAGCINDYDASNLSRMTGAIVILVNYRLSALGYLALPELLDAGQSTNVGLFDQQLGLSWARDSAAAFGGDPKKITICGQSAGGAAVSFHLVMPSSRGLFQAAILMSPGGRKGWVEDLKEDDNDALSTSELMFNAKQLAVSRGCGASKSAARVACMRNLSLDALLAEPFGRFAPGADGVSVPSLPLDAIRSGHWASNADVIIGSTSCEACAGEGMHVHPGPPRNVSAAEYYSALNQTFGPGRFLKPVDISPNEVDKWYAKYRARRGNWQTLTRIASDNSHACTAHFLAAALIATSKAAVRRYEFRAAGGHPGQLYPGAVHASELQYLFRSTPPYEPSHLSPAQDALAKHMQALWGSFASGSLDDSAWPACKADGAHGACDRVLLLDTPSATLGSEADVDDGSAVLQCKHWEPFMT